MKEGIEVVDESDDEFEFESSHSEDSDMELDDGEEKKISAPRY